MRFTLTLLAVFAWSLSSAFGGNFLAPSRYPVAGHPQAIVAGDFNGDGRLDLITVSTGQATGVTYSLLLGNPDGTFQSSQNSKLSLPQPSKFALAAGDMNNDGKLDLLVLVLGHSGGNNLYVFLGNGDGSFQKHNVFASGAAADGIVVGDWNADGKLDVATANDEGVSVGLVGVLLGNGDGTLQTAQTYNLVSCPLSITTGDFNNDGRLDLVATNGGTNDVVSVLLGNGDGSFQPATTFHTGAFPQAVAVADFNHDGNLDIMTVDENASSLAVLLGNGDGTFQQFKNSVVGTGLTFAADLADFNHDGNLDAVVSSVGTNDPPLAVMIGDGTGSFKLAQTVPAGAGIAIGIAGDFNGDGFADIASASGGSQGVVVSLNKGQ